MPGYLFFIMRLPLTTRYKIFAFHTNCTVSEWCLICKSYVTQFVNDNVKAGRGLASERPRGPPRRARLDHDPARGALPRGAGRRARASEAQTGLRPRARRRSERGREAGPRPPPRRPAHRRAGHGGCARAADSTYLVDPASSHMLVSKAKPCTCKHRPPHGEAANGSLDWLQFIRSYAVTWITDNLKGLALHQM